MTVCVFRQNTDATCGRLTFRGAAGDTLLHWVRVPDGSEVLDTVLLGEMLFVPGSGRDRAVRVGYEPHALVRAAQDGDPRFRLMDGRDADGQPQKVNS